MKWEAFTCLGDNPKAVTWDDFCEVQHIIQVWADGGLLLWELEKTNRLDDALTKRNINYHHCDDY